MDYYSYIFERYNYYYSRRDQRVIEWPLLSRPHDMIYLVIAYNLFIIIGQRLMKHSKPFDLKYPLLFHNLICFFINLYMVFEIPRQLYINDYKFMCNVVDYSEKGIGMASVLWLFFFSKFIELLDTVFMVLRKKDNQITGLHVYHHSTVGTLWYIGMLYVAGGDSYFSALMNSFVHVIMYGYYTLSLLGYNIWWKKYLTQIQLVQFFINIITSIAAIYLNCDFPSWMHWGMLIYMSSFIVLFGLFYKKAYSSKNKTT